MCYFDINDLRLGSGDFDFFATQNVFAPGRHIIKVDSAQGMAAPHDVLLVGDIVDPAALVSLPTPLASVDSADGDDTSPAPGPQPLARLKMLLLNDQDFVQKTFAALRDGKTRILRKQSAISNSPSRIATCRHCVHKPRHRRLLISDSRLGFTRSTPQPAWAL